MTSAARIACPGADEIERSIRSDSPDAAIRAHIDVCAACREQFESIAENVRFMDGFLGTLGEAATEPVARPAPPSPDALPGYHLNREIARGGQGVVYEATQIETQRRVAVKMIDSISPASGSRGGRARQRIEREAAIAAGLRHPNIVTVFHSAPLSDGRYALAMEFVDGVPIDQWTPPGDTPAQRQRELLRVFIAVASAVHHAHLSGVIHRDLKPDNILVTSDGDAGPRPVVLDFGVAKAEGVHATMTGEFAGTPAYASPEQVAGKPAEVNALTDVYSLGVILYRLLCRRMPYEFGGSLLEVVRTITETAPVPPRQIDPSLSPDLEAIILCALSKERSLRYQSAAAFARDLERFLDGAPVEARSASGWYVLRKALVINRRRLLAAAAAIVLVLAAAAAVLISMQRAADSSRREQSQREQAAAERVRAAAVTELLREALPSPDPARPEIASVIGSGLGNLYFRLEAGEFADQPEVDQALRRLWGGVYTGLGSAKAAGLVQYAEVSLRNGLTQLKLKHGLRHPDVAATMHELAGVLLVRNRLPEAERMSADALAMRIDLLGADSLSAAESRALHARILHAQGRSEEAESEAIASLSILKSFPPRETDLLIASMFALQARSRIDSGRACEAGSLVLEALERRLGRLAPEDPELLASLSDAADVADACPDCELAQALSRAWKADLSTLGPRIRADIPVIASFNRGDPHRPAQTGRTAALGRLGRLAAELLGPDDPALVRVLTAQVRSAEGELLLEPRSDAALHAAEILARRFGPDDSSRLVFLEDAVMVLAYSGDGARAADIAREVLRIRQRVSIEARDQLVIANTLRTIGWCLTLAGDWSAAITELHAAIDLLHRTVGPDHHLVALAESNLAFCLAQTGKLDDAAALSARATHVADRTRTASADQLAQIRLARGHVLFLTDQLPEAITLLERVWAEQYHKSRTNFPWRRVCVEDLAAAHARLGHTDQASLWRARIDGDPHAPIIPPAAESSEKPAP